MKKTSFFIILLLLLLPLISSHLFADTRGIRVISKHGQSLYLYKDYHALIVGVSDYEKWPNLPNAVKDAEEVSRILKRLGFTVKLTSNPTSRELKKVFNDMAYRYGREENRAILFYYAGHGETEVLADGTKLGYIIPRDCPLLRDDPQAFVNRAISMKDIESYSLRIRSKHVLMLFDSCFSGSLFSLVRAVPEDITEKSSLPVRQYITAGTEDESVPDRSMFKRCLLLGLEGDADLTRDGYITGTELGLYLSDKVVQSTNRAQHPQYGKIRTPELARGDFIFQLASSAAIVEEPGRASLSVESNVVGARVLIDGQEIGSAPLTDVAVSSGKHKIRVEKQGYEPYGKQVRIEAGRAMSIYVDLNKAVPEKGRLFVETEPEDANVRITNIAQDFYQGIELEEGHYNVEVSVPGYETKNMWVSIIAGEDKNLNIRLKKIKISSSKQKGLINLKKGLIAYYSFNSNANDESGNGNDGTVHGATPTEDRFGNPNSAYRFDGVDDYIEIPHSESLNVKEEISISLWIKLESSAPYYFPYHIIEKSSSWGIGQRNWDINSGITGSSGDYYNVWTTNLRPEVYYNFVMTFDGSILKVYKNGLLAGSKDYVGKILQTDSNIMISNYELRPDLDYHFDGIIDDIRIYNRALSKSEIYVLYNASTLVP